MSQQIACKMLLMKMCIIDVQSQEGERQGICVSAERGHLCLGFAAETCVFCYSPDGSVIHKVLGEPGSERCKFLPGEKRF